VTMLVGVQKPGLPGRSGGCWCRLVAVELQEVVGGGGGLLYVIQRGSEASFWRSKILDIAAAQRPVAGHACMDVRCMVPTRLTGTQAPASRCGAVVNSYGSRNNLEFAGCFLKMGSED
jgi:hypothetical protein